MSDHIDPFLVTARHVGVLAIQPNAVTPQPIVFYVPYLVMTVQIALLSGVVAVMAPIMYFVGAALPISSNLR